MNLDIGALQSTNNAVVSYNILGMADSDTLPAWRLTSKNSSAGVLTGFMALAHSACRGLMGNDTAMTQLKVRCCHLQTLSQRRLAHSGYATRCAAMPKLCTAVCVLKMPRSCGRGMSAAGLWGRCHAEQRSGTCRCFCFCMSPISTS